MWKAFPAWRPRYTYVFFGCLHTLAQVVYRILLNTGPPFFSDAVFVQHQRWISSLPFSNSKTITIFVFLLRFVWNQTTRTWWRMAWSTQWTPSVRSPWRSRSSWRRRSLLRRLWLSAAVHSKHRWVKQGRILHACPVVAWHPSFSPQVSVDDRFVFSLLCFSVNFCNSEMLLNRADFNSELTWLLWVLVIDPFMK